MSGAGFSGGIDHIHVYVTDRKAAGRWYQDILGLSPAPGLEIWSDDPAGPLTLEDKSGAVHLALFARNPVMPVSFAFGVSAAEYLAWKTSLENLDIDLAERDHTLFLPLYFEDPDGNGLEITTYDAEAVRSFRQAREA